MLSCQEEKHANFGVFFVVSFKKNQNRMRIMLLFFSMMVLRCCWGPTEYQLLQDIQDRNTIVKTLNDSFAINTLNQEDISIHKLSVSFNENTKKVSGFSGCNRFFGHYSLNKNTLTFSELGATKMLCSEEKNKVESELLKTLQRSNNILFTEEGFVLFKNKRPLLSATKLQEHNKMSFEYSATSRSAFKTIKIEKDSIVFSKKRKGKSLKTACDTVFWQKLIKISNGIDIQNISNLTAPSKAFRYDGAPLARLKITSNGTTYESAPFDHGNPPKEISSLVKEILSITENIE